jgi:hypothetical protein
MKLGFTLIVIAALAGLVGALAPIDGFSMLPAMMKIAPARGVAMGAGFALPLLVGLFAFAKQRMSKGLGVAALVGFIAAGASIEIWKMVQHLGDNMPLTLIIIAGATALGLVGSIIALVKGNND